MPKIGVKQPPWWKDRELSILSKLGRGGLTDLEKLNRKARLLERDSIETAKCSEIHFSEPVPALGAAERFVRHSASSRASSPDLSSRTRSAAPPMCRSPMTICGKVSAPKRS